MGIELHSVLMLGRDIPVKPDISPYQLLLRNSYIIISFTFLCSDDKSASSTKTCY